MGRFGPVYQAYDPATNQPAVVRTFTQPMDADAEARLVQALTRLCDAPPNHTSIARPLAAGTESGHPFLVHTLLPGVPLETFLRRYGSQPFADVVQRVTQLAEAIDFAAAAGVHHGALGPADVMLAPGSAGISGFGLVQAMNAAGIAVDGDGRTSADVSALAAIAFELLYGQPPRNAAAVRANVSGADPTRLKHAFDAALGEDPDGRPATAREFAARLQESIVDASTAPPAFELSEADFRPEIAPAEPATHLDEAALRPRLAWEAKRSPDLSFRRDFSVTPADADADLAVRSHELRPESVATPPLFAPVDVPHPRRGRGGLVLLALVIGLATGFAGGFFAGQSRERPGVSAVPAAVTGRVPSPSVPPAPELPPSQPPAPVNQPSVPRSSTAALRAEPAIPESRESRIQTAPDAPGSMQVLSRPEGAQVYVDGTLVGRTPLVVAAVRPGAHDVRIDLAGHRPWTTSILVEPGQPTRVAASLEP